MLELFLQIVLVSIMGWLAISSSIMVSEKKRLQREGKIDYYGNPIEQDNER